MAKKPDTSSRIADNKKAAYNYFFEERHEAGMVLHGWEVKALREGTGVVTPKWLTFDAQNLTGTVAAMPAREDIDCPIEEHLIVELYSR